MYACVCVSLPPSRLISFVIDSLRIARIQQQQQQHKNNNKKKQQKNITIAFIDSCC